MHTDTAIKALAEKALSCFFFTGDKPKRKHLRPNIWLTKDKTPEWVVELCRAAHEGLGLPDDTRYSYIVDALDALVNHENEDEARDAIRDGVDIYNHALFAWLASHGQRYGYVDQAQDDGLVAPDTDLIARLQAGQSVEREEVFQSVLDSLHARAED